MINHDIETKNICYLEVTYLIILLYSIVVWPKQTIRKTPQKTTTQMIRFPSFSGLAWFSNILMQTAGSHKPQPLELWLENPPLIAVKIADVPIQSFQKKPIGFSEWFEKNSGFPYKSPISHGFPMVFPWFSRGFPMFFPWFSHDLSIQLSFNS